LDTHKTRTDVTNIGKDIFLSAVGKTGKTLEQMLTTTTYTFRNNTQAGNHLFPLTNIEELHRSTCCHLKYYKVQTEMLPGYERNAR
jgi:hypothetical protein